MIAIISFFFLFFLLKNGNSSSSTSDILSSNVITSKSNLKAYLSNYDIKCILSDVDGTLLSSNHVIGTRTYDSIKNAIAAGFKVFPCTGRSRKSMQLATGDKFMNLFGDISIGNVPGVYQQGLMVYNDKGQIIYERLLDNDVIVKVEEFCEEHDLGLIAYCGERIIAKKTNAKTNFIEKYKEPIPESYPSGLGALQPNGIKVHKLILLDNDDILIKVRPLLEKRIASIASTTKAVPGMLEVLPLNASKGYGVKKLLEYYNIESKATIAFGDGENDKEMLEQVMIGAAVSNAKDLLKSVAKIIIGSNDEEGVATCIEALNEIRNKE